MIPSADVLIIGAGVVGLSIAYHLKKNGFGGEVAVLEREEAVAQGSTSKAVGGVRMQFSSEVNVRLSQLSIPAFERFNEEVSGHAEFRQRGYLFVTSDADTWGHLQGLAERQRAWGVTVESWPPERIREFLPDLRASDLLGGNFCPLEGFADPSGVAAGYARAAERLGALVLRRTEAKGIVTKGGEVAGVEVESAREEDPGRHLIRTRVLVNAAGPHAREVALWVGLDLPALPFRRQVFVSNEVSLDYPERFPMVIELPAGIYLCSGGTRMLFGKSKRDEPSGFNPRKYGLFDPFSLEALSEVSRRFPLITSFDEGLSWCGHYCETPDRHPIVGPVPRPRGFINAVGFSGHGFMHSPAIGQLLSELIIEGKTSSLDLSPLSLERFEGGKKGTVETLFI